jgi:hypothetical protein
MEYKTLFINSDLHKRIKVHSTLLDESIREYVEKALLARLQAESDYGLLVDSREPYRTQEAPHG